MLNKYKENFSNKFLTRLFVESHSINISDYSRIEYFLDLYNMKPQYKEFIKYITANPISNEYTNQFAVNVIRDFFNEKEFHVFNIISFEKILTKLFHQNKINYARLS